MVDFPQAENLPEYTQTLTRKLIKPDLKFHNKEYLSRQAEPLNLKPLAPLRLQDSRYSQCSSASIKGIAVKLLRSWVYLEVHGQL